MTWFREQAQKERDEVRALQERIAELERKLHLAEALIDRMFERIEPLYPIIKGFKETRRALGDE